MKNRILLDTSIIIDYLRQKQKGVTKMGGLLDLNMELVVSIITHTEVYSGKSVWEWKDARKTIEIIFGGLTILPLTTEISEKAGGLTALSNIPLIDAIIASTAIVYDVPFATLNVKHFNKIKGLKLID